MAHQEVRRAHMLTKGYMRAWADERNRLDVIDLSRNYGYPSSVNNATILSYAYEPSVLPRNLEQEYSIIESNGVAAIAKLRREDLTLDGETLAAMIAFLDMHLDRGRYADQTAVRTPASLLMTDGTVKDVKFNVADRLLLSQSIKDVVRLKTLGVGSWEWRIFRGEFVTGDGAVLLFRETEGAEVCTVAFPLSPTQLLVIGKPFAHPVPLNSLIAGNSRRWLVGRRGSLRRGPLVPPGDAETGPTDGPPPARAR
ncbi:DUF4238 domain-containing protein [Curtobacterium sp. MCBD17_003]|uniref:DUF4238 domain-containing protein n=1 Tax=Curtobacterium sp. MCBD17_003 TaxID=2175667 RepID=UPI000DA85203|nr:DUF4238 domain-containing protein [Curtobacterium sp. MCBD17_003]WIE56301.1 DUF4238 domain-containing protein [Curtobacterium sp. MCBD17_003]